MGDPAQLRAIIGNPAAYPGSPPSPVQSGAGGAPGGAPGEAPKAPPKAEPVDLHDRAVKAKELATQLRTELEELGAAAEMAETIDPNVEKVLSAAAQMVVEIDDSLTDAVDELGAARADHEALMAPEKK